MYQHPYLIRPDQVTLAKSVAVVAIAPVPHVKFMTLQRTKHKSTLRCCIGCVHLKKKNCPLELAALCGIRRADVLLTANKRMGLRLLWRI